MMLGSAFGVKLKLQSSGVLSPCSLVQLPGTVNPAVPGRGVFTILY